MTTINVSLLVFGDSTKEGKQFWRLYDKSPKYQFFQAIDVRKVMSVDPRNAKKFRVAHEHNADFCSTQTNMLNNESFPETVREVVDSVQKYREELGPGSSTTSLGGIVPVLCTAGQHRADSAAKWAARKVLNSLMDGDARV